MEINNETLIERQVRVLSTCFPGAQIIAVLGFEAEKIEKVLPPFVDVVHNNDFETSNISLSIKIATEKSENNKCLYVYGDLVFDSGWFPPLNQSWTIYDTKNQLPKDNVGITNNSGYVTNFSYGLPNKWGQVTYLENLELDIFKKAYKENRSEKLFGFELLNKVIHHGGLIRATEPNEMVIFEIDSIKDLQKAREHCEKY